MRGTRTFRRVLLAGIGAAVLLAPMACATGDDTKATDNATSPTSPAAPAPTTTTSPSPTGTSTTGQLTGIPVYWIAESRRSFRLYREFRSVPKASGGTAASDLAERALQQLVYTATAAAEVGGRDATSVSVTVNGGGYDAWGVIRVGAPMRRAPLLDVQALVWVVSPRQGEVRKPGIVTFTGYGTSFEATFAWKVATAAGAVAAQGSAMGGTGTGGFGAFTFSAPLGRGSYTVLVSTDDPSGGASGLGPATDDKDFTVN